MRTEGKVGVGLIYGDRSPDLPRHVDKITVKDIKSKPSGFDWAAARGVPAEPAGTREERVEEAWQRWGTVTKVAAELRMSTKTVSRILAERGLRKHKTW